MYFSYMLIIFLLLVQQTLSSLGDLFPLYRDCRNDCERKLCDSGIDYLKPNLYPFYIRLLWSCSENCKYDCMWLTVDGFMRKGWPPPQFHGKWPFVRLLGIQEPASAIFSVLNLLMHIKMFKKYVKEVRKTSQMFYLWSFYAIVCFNGWFWSVIFHARDIFFTETMDYLSAFSMVFYSIYISVMRALRNKRLYSAVWTLICLFLFSQHALYLTVGGFDYKYNLMANIAAGAVSGSICLTWSLLNLRKAPHARFLTVTVSLIGLTTLLEVAEFPPYLWTLDAHALWHLSTIPVPYFFWRFAIEDSKYLSKQEHSG